MTAVCMACPTKSTVAWNNKSLLLECSNCGDAGAYLVNPFSQGSNLIDRVMLDAWRSLLSDGTKKNKLRTIIDSYRDGVCEGASLCWMREMMDSFKRSYTDKSLVDDSHRVKNLTADAVRKVVKEAMDKQSELLEHMTYTHFDKNGDPVTDVTKVGGQKNNSKAIQARSVALEKTYGTGFKQLGWEGKGYYVQFKTNPSSMSTLRDLLLKGGLTGTQKGILGRPLLALFSEQDKGGGHAMAICFTRKFNKKGQTGVIFFDPNLGELFYNSKESAFGGKAKLGIFPFVEKEYGPVELYFLDFYSPLGA